MILSLIRMIIETAEPRTAQLCVENPNSDIGTNQLRCSPESERDRDPAAKAVRLIVEGNDNRAEAPNEVFRKLRRVWTMISSGSCLC